MRPPRRAPLGPQPGDSVTQSGSATPGAGRGERVGGGAGRARAEPGAAELSRVKPSRAEPSCEVPGRGRQSLPAAPHPSCCVSRLGVPLPLPRHRQNFYCFGDPPWMCDEIATLRCLVPQARLQRRSRERATLAAGLLRPALPHLPIAPGNREGGPLKGPRGHRHPEILFTVADRLGATLT